MKLHPIINTHNNTHSITHKTNSKQTNPFQSPEKTMTNPALAFLFTILFFSTSQCLTTPKCNTQDEASTLQIMHVNSPCSPFSPKFKAPLSWEQSVLQMQSDDESRLRYLSSLVAVRSVAPIASGRAVTQNPTYVVRAKFGTPPQSLLMAIDTSGDAALVPCAGCLGCSSSAAFDSSLSSTFKPLPCGASQCGQVPNPKCGGTTCGFNTTYGNAAIAANLGQDNITLATDSVTGFTFGCVQSTTGTSLPVQGLLGLGRGQLSVITQSASLYQSTFSYCLPSYKSANFTGSLRLGPIGQPTRIKYSPLLRNPRRPSLYYVNLLAIRVGRRVVDIPPSALAFNPTTGAGTVFDSGTVFTSLVKPVYTIVRDEFRRRMGSATVSSLGGFDTCYTVPVTVPTITFMFSGMNFTLPPDNFLIRSTAGTISCLAMAAAPDNVNSVLNVIASFQQQNHRILIDLPNSKLGVAREPCS